VHDGKAGTGADVVFFTVKDASHSLHGIKAAWRPGSACANGPLAGWV